MIYFIKEIAEATIEINKNGYFFPEENVHSELPRSLLAKFMLDDAEKDLFKEACGVAIGVKIQSNSLVLPVIHE
jgi:hypothetical protein